MSRFVRTVEALDQLDRRWVFLAVGLAVVISTLFRLTFPEIPTPMVRDVFDQIESLPPGSRVLMPFDYDKAEKAMDSAVRFLQDLFAR